MERKNPPISEPCILHLDLFIEELKRHPLLHDAAFTVPQARKVGVTERLALPYKKEAAPWLVGITITVQMKKGCCKLNYQSIHSSIFFIASL